MARSFVSAVVASSQTRSGDFATSTRPLDKVDEEAEEIAWARENYGYGGNSGTLTLLDISMFTQKPAKYWRKVLGAVRGQARPSKSPGRRPRHVVPDSLKVMKIQPGENKAQFIQRLARLRHKVGGQLVHMYTNTQISRHVGCSPSYVHHLRKAQSK